MDQTCKFGEPTPRILEFKPEELDFQSIINLAIVLSRDFHESSQYSLYYYTIMKFSQKYLVKTQLDKDRNSVSHVILTQLYQNQFLSRQHSKSYSCVFTRFSVNFIVCVSSNNEKNIVKTQLDKNKNSLHVVNSKSILI